MKAGVFERYGLLPTKTKKKKKRTKKEKQIKKSEKLERVAVMK